MQNIEGFQLNKERQNLRGTTQLEFVAFKEDEINSRVGSVNSNFNMYVLDHAEQWCNDPNAYGTGHFDSELYKKFMRMRISSSQN